MIDVEQLSKEYGTIRAVSGLTFRIGRGEVVGFLGPNGAGKTTTMRMLTTFLPPSSGRARLAGHDVLDESIEVRKKVGYLPENVPLYPEMRIQDYLDYRARLKDVPRSKRRSAIERAMERCHLAENRRRLLGHLSRGFRQRVGLADAILHEPDILILDEPTAGLDPIQIRDVRALIKELGEEHTVLLSTHIMSEVEAVCDRVLMIVKGRIARDEPLDRLRSDRSIVIEARGEAHPIANALRAQAGVADVKVTRNDAGVSLFEVRTEGDADLREPLARCVVQLGAGLLGLERRRSDLEDWFVEAVRDASIEHLPVAQEVA